MVKLLQRIVRWFFMRIENVFNIAFGDKLNPFYHLGTISFWQFWLLVGSGLYLYIFADPGVHDAFDSVERITHNQWWAGGILRSIHRYATDGMILTMLLHICLLYTSILALGRIRPDGIPRAGRAVHPSNIRVRRAIWRTVSDHVVGAGRPSRRISYWTCFHYGQHHLHCLLSLYS